MEERKVTFREVLGIPSFRLLWVGQLISNFGDRFSYMAVMGLILFRWEGSALDAGMMFVIMALPSIFIGPVAGVFVDRYDKKKVMIVSDLVRAALIALLSQAQTLMQVYVLIFLVAVVSRFFYPSRSAMIPALVEKRQLIVANSLSQSTYQTSAILGYALGGMLVALIGPVAVFYLDSVSFLVSAVLIAMISYTAVTSAVADIGLSPLMRIRREFVDGLAYVYNDKRILFITTLFSSVLLFFGGLNVVWLILVRDVMGLGVEGMGIVESVLGGGMLAGTFFVGIIGQRMGIRPMLLGGTIVFSLAFFAIAAFTVLPNVIIWLFIAGISNEVIVVPCITLLQEITPEHMLGRVFSAFGTALESASLISMGVLGYLASTVPVHSLLFAMSACILMVVLVASLVPVSLERVPLEDAAPAPATG
ncbi:MFS transporter [archaeon]|nr:MAG: MFS transporter [archaeon]